MFTSTILSSKEGWLYEKNVKNTQEQLLKLIYNGTLQGRYDLRRREYLPLSVIKRFDDERTYYVIPPPPPRDMWSKRKEHAKRKDIVAGMANDFRDMDIYRFDGFVVDLLERSGYATKTTPSYEDHGNDILAEKGGEIILVKAVKKSLDEKIGLKEVRNAVDIMESFNANRTILVTNTSFTKTAREVEHKSHDIEVWDGEELKKLLAEHYMNGTSGDDIPALGSCLILDGIFQASFFKTLLSKGARFAPAAGLFATSVAAPGVLQGYPQLHALRDDLGFGQVDDGVSEDHGISLYARFGSHRKGLLECPEEFGTTVGITAIIHSVSTDENCLCAYALGVGKGVTQQYNIPCRYVG